MNDQSPPKRVTRARAAAKSTNDTGVKTTQIATAASKAKVTRAASTTKRKTRADDIPEVKHEEPTEQIIEPELPKTTRGRTKKVAVQPEPEMEEEAPAPAPTKTTRGRPKKAVVETPAPAPTRSLRGRAKTVEIEEQPEEAIVVEEPAKKPTRARAATISKATAPKKTVKFEEPDKENIVPPPANAKGKAKATETGLKAKPVRKVAAPATRTTRGRGKVEEKEQKSSPLSPKKATQVAMAKDQSDDELATNEKTPMKPLMKSPIKAPGSIFGTAKKLDFSNSITVNRVVTKDLGASMLGSPARRPAQSPLKESMKSEPQRPTLGDSILRSPFKFSHPTQKPVEASSPFKASLLQSPARRPQSPTKISENGSPTRSRDASTFGATPKASTFNISRYATPRTVTKSAIRPGQMLPPTNTSTGSPQSKSSSDSDTAGETSLKFSGRLSSIMPRDADPALTSPEPIVEEVQDQVMTEEEPAGETIAVDTIAVEDAMEAQTSTPPTSPQQNSSFALREVDENPFHDSDSEDELASASPKYSPIPLTSFKTFSPATPTPFTAISKTPRTGITRKSGFPQNHQIGFTPLAAQLSSWMQSPVKSDLPQDISVSQEGNIEVQPSPIKSSYFDDEMSVRNEMEDVPGPAAIIEDIHFDPVDLDEEDLSLAHEADEMSLLDPESIEEIVNGLDDADEVAQVEFTDQAFNDLINAEPEAQDIQQLAEIEIPTEVNKMILEAEHVTEEMIVTQPEEVQISEAPTAVEPTTEITEPEPALSEASQEYGDENAMVLDPALFAPAPQALASPKYSTPKRVLSERVFHTVSKVPLKAAAEDSLMRPSPIKRSTSVSRLPVQRPSSNLSRSNTVISYSPSKRTTRVKTPTRDVEMQDVDATPSKPDAEVWAAIATPARTPRRDLNTALLKGAVVFVDVHTTEGADASALFTELLTQMGARCVKRWDWNGNSDDGKVGITHVVFKDGGKRTLEKAKETGGVVSCVGVGWVLDCERENKWLPESPYSVDTAIVPRGGHRRRKSMEPRALANMNGTLLPSATPIRPGRKTMSPSKDFMNHHQTPMTSKSRRRDSVQWVHTPSSSSSDDKSDDQTLMLSPVPATPAPEVISAYGEEGLYGDDTPGGQTPYFLHKEQLVQKTAPPGKRYFDGENGNGGFLSEKKDESVMMRLMAARRKSLQWAPKIGSPLARGGEW